jgi:hypothetical protein
MPTFFWNLPTLALAGSEDFVTLYSYLLPVEMSADSDQLEAETVNWELDFSSPNTNVRGSVP